MTLTACTSPGAIADAQRRAIEAVLARRRATAAEISDEIHLPVSIVEKRLKEIRAARRKARQKR